MFTCRLPGAFICRQCQSRLPRRCCLALLKVVEPFPRFASSTAPDEPPEINTPPSIVGSTNKGRLKPSGSADRFGRLQGRKRKRLRESSAALGVNALGTPSEIIILRDATSTHEEAKTSSTAENIQDNKSLSKEEILAGLQRENATPTHQEVNKAIESFKPPPLPGADERVYLSRQKYQELFQKLYSGFTYGQLHRYIKHVHPARSQELKKGKWTKLSHSRSEWCPGIRPIEERLVSIPRMKRSDDVAPSSDSAPPVEKGPSDTEAISALGSSRKTPKGTVIERIMQSCWNIEINEIIDSIGQLELRLPRWAFELVQVSGSQNNLDHIRSLRKCRIDVYAPHRVVRITGDKETTEYAADDVMQRLLQTKKQDFDLKPFKDLLGWPSNFDATKNLDLFLNPEDLTLASNLSRTLIRAAGPESLLIRGFEQADLDLAQMVMLDMLDMPNERRSHLIAEATAFPGAKFHAASFENTLSYKARRKNLGRWVLPVAKVSRQKQVDTESEAENPEGHGTTVSESEVENDGENKEPNEMSTNGNTPPVGEAAEDSRTIARKELLDLLGAPLRTPVFPKQSLKDAEKGVSPPSYWPATPKTEIFGSFGHVLHFLDGRMDLSTLFRDWRTNNREPRAFSSAIPGIARSLSRLPNLHEPSMRALNSVSLRLIPSPWNQLNSLVTHEYPPITLRWHVDPYTRETKFQSMSAEIGSRAIDYLLPGHVTDIRLVKRETIHALSEVFLESSQQLRSFISSVEAALQSDGLLTAPPKVNISIPKWFISQHSKSPHKIKKEWKRATEVELEYAPVRFEHHQMMRIAFGSHTLSYTSIEGGTLGGRRGELRLRIGGGHFERTKGGSASLSPLTGSTAADQIESEHAEETSTSTDDARTEMENAGKASSPAYLKDFVQSCFSLADLIHSSAQEDNPSLHVPPSTRAQFKATWSSAV